MSNIYEPKLSSLSIVLIGKFNPAIFQPEWFAREKLISDEQANSIKIKLIHSELVVLEDENFLLNATLDSFSIRTDKDDYFKMLKDLSINIFTLLRHTPLHSMGINRNLHYELDDEKVWNNIGHKLAPKEPWKNLLNDPGMLEVHMQGGRDDDYSGNINVSVQPYQRFKYGVHIRVNDHFDAIDSNNSSELIGYLSDVFDKSMEQANKIANTLINL